MSLPIESLRDLTGKSLAVSLTLLLGPNVEVKDYPDCYALRINGEVYVFAYADHQDGQTAHPRARWAGNLVVGVEHFGNHPEHPEWQQAHTPPQQRQQKPQQAAGADYAPAAPTLAQRPVKGLTLPEAVVAPHENPAAVPSIAESPDFEGDEKATPPGPSSTPSSVSGTTTLPPSAPMTEELPPFPLEDILGTSHSTEQTAWMPPVDPEEEPEEGWKPRSRPTPHKAPQSAGDVQQRTLRGSRGTAKRAVRGMGTALLLGFALLGYTPGR